MMTRWLPATLFGRLALLLGVAVVVSHVMALTLMFRLLPGPHGQPGHPGPPPHASAGAPVPPDGHLGPDVRGQQPVAPQPLDEGPPPGPAGGPPGVWAYPGLLADVGVRLHPDHRADLVFEQVLRAPIAGRVTSAASSTRVRRSAPASASA